MPPMIRMNPTRAPMMKPIGTALPQTAPATHVAEQISGPLFSHLGHFANPVNLRRGHNTNGKWIAGATKNAHGQFRSKAKAAGKTTAEYAREKSSAPGKLGKQARLAKTLMGLH